MYVCVRAHVHIRGSGGNIGGIRGEGEYGSEGSRAKNKVLQLKEFAAKLSCRFY